ncbi:MAG: Ig-like domain-containing protein, partial [Thermoplasmata archaeon]
MASKSLSATKINIIIFLILSSMFNNFVTDYSNGENTLFLISGFISDQNGLRVNQANISFKDETSGAIAYSTTDMNGYYYCMLPPESWNFGDTFNLTIEKANTYTCISGIISSQMMSLDITINWTCKISFLLENLSTPTKLCIGKNANFTYILTNTGNDTEKFNLSYELPIGWNAFLSSENLTLIAGESAIVSLLVTPLGGSIQIGETVTINLTAWAARNSTISQKQISICKLIYDVDLSINSSDISFVYPTSQDPYVFPMEIRAKLRNLGNENVSHVSVRFYIDGAYLFGLVLENLFSHIYAPYTVVSAPWTPSAGLHNVTLILDENNEIEETDETNNQATVYLLTDHPPEVDIISPSNCSIISGNVTIHGNVHDVDHPSNLEVQISIPQVSYHANANVSGETWNLTIDTTQFQNGNYTIVACAYDGFLYSSNISILVKVANQVSKPIVNIFSPFENETVSTVLQIRGNASDNDGDLAGLEICLDEEDYFSPTIFWLGEGELNFSYELDTTILSEGLHTVHAKAFDYSGLSSECMVNFSV